MKIFPNYDSKLKQGTYVEQLNSYYVKSMYRDNSIHEIVEILQIPHSAKIARIYSHTIMRKLFEKIMFY